MRIGILGGTFDPIHYGHLEIAIGVQQFFALDKVHLMPAYSPPHKHREQISSAYHRYAMAILATTALEQIRVSRLELEAPAKPFTAQTILQLKQSWGSEVEIFFIMGADTFRELTYWRDYQNLITNCTIIAVTRPGYDLSLTQRPSPSIVPILDLRGQRKPLTEIPADTRIFLTDLIERDVSATMIRAAVAESQPLDQYVPESVARYIAKYQLYQKINNNDTN